MAPREPIDVPQTTLRKIRAVVDACAKGAATAAALEERTGLSGRHVGYALVGARTLGLVGGEPENLALTTRGRHLAASMSGSEEERIVFRAAVSDSADLSRLAPGLIGDHVPSRADVVARMVRLGGLSPETADHRAGMLLRWRREIVDPQLRLRQESTGMWRRVEITNYRSIEHAEVDLAPFTLVVGRNGAGKSNFADALVFARDVAFDAATAVSHRGGLQGVRRYRPSKPTDPAIDVRAAATAAHLDDTYVRHFFKLHSGKAGDFTFSREEIEIVERGKQKAHVERTSSGTTGSVNLGAQLSASASAMVLARQLKPFAGISPLQNVRRYRLNPAAMREPRLATDDARLQDAGENIAAAVKALRDGKRWQFILDAMAKIVPGLTDIEVEQVSRFLTLKFKQRQGGAIADFNATEMSDGALRALGIIVAAEQMQRDELLIVEEPETAIHAGAAGLLFELLKEASRRGAVLVTTHSAELLDAASAEEILVCEYDGSATQIGPLAEAQRQVVRDGLFSIAELMRSEPLRIERPATRRRAGASR